MSRELAPWKPRSGEWDTAAAHHFHARAGFGASRDELEASRAAGLEASVAALFAADDHDAALLGGMRSLLAAGDEDTLRAWWMALILSGRAPLRERMTLFWHDHFATSNAKVDDVRLMHRQNGLLRVQGLGDLRELLHAMAKDPAMLVWLDGNLNRRGQANENFAREVMELFALGIGHYTERDVQEAARAFTGWGTKGRAFHDRRDLHDAGVKEVLGQRGSFDGEAVIDVLLAQPACARHVARRLLQEFVEPTPAEERVDALAKTLVGNDWHVGRTLEALFASRLFHDRSLRRSRVAGPVELVAATVRRLGASVAPKVAAEAAAEMGQALFRPPSVKGWDGGRTWIDAGTWVARHNALAGLASAGKGGADGVRVDLEAAFGAARDRADLARRVERLLLPDGVTRPQRRLLVRAAEAADDERAAWADVTALVLTSPEYQLT